MMFILRFLKRKILEDADYLDGDWDNLQAKIKSSWYKYLNREIKLIRQAVSNLEPNIDIDCK